MKVTKKVLSVVLALFMVLSVFSCLTFTVSAYSPIATYSEDVENEDGETETQVFWTLYDNGELVVNEIPYNEETGVYEVGWYGYRNLIKSVVFISQDVIPSRLFDGYPNLEAADLFSVVRIDGYAFQNCPKLKNVEFGISLHTLGDYAFYNCPALKTVDLKNSLGDNTIVGAEDAYVGKNVFKNCVNLEKAVFGNGCKVVGYGMFEGCKALATVNLPDSIKEIGEHAFEECASLTGICIPDSTETVGDYAFYRCSGLKDVCIGHKANSLGNYLFAECTALEKIQIKSSVETIGNHTFYNCSSIKNFVDFPESVKVINESAFEGCSSLEALKLPSTVQKIGKNAFRDCKALTDIALGNNVTDIEAGTFYNSGLEKIDIPDSVTAITASAFSKCGNLTEINVDEANESYKSTDGILYNSGRTNLILCPSAKSGKVVIPSTVVSLDAGSFANCKNLTEIVIGGNVTSIPENTFIGCSEDLIITTNCDTAAAAFVAQKGLNTDGVKHINGTEWKVTVSATCLNNGQKSLVCKGCGKVMDSEVIKALGHNFDNGTVTKNATCTTDGVKTFVCTNEGCEEFYTEVIKATGHKYDTGVVTKEATCTEDGVKTFSCIHDGCEDFYTEVIKATGHKYDTGVVTEEPTCTEDGVKTFSCIHDGCEDFYTKPVKATGHKLDSGVVTKAPTCTEEGEMTFSCTADGCDYQETKPIAATKHSFAEDMEAYVAPECGVKGSHTYRCTNPGCEEFYVEDIEQLVHEYKGVVTKESNCTGKREITYTCGLCGDSYKVYEQPKHYYLTTYSVDKEPTATEPGLKSHHCAVCGQSDGDYVQIPVTKIKLDAPVIYNDQYFANKGKNNVDYIVKDGIAVKWGAVKNAEGYFVYRKTVGESYKKIATVKSPSYTDKNVKSGVKYAYRIAAYCGAVKSANSDALTLTYLATPAVNVGNTSNGVNVTWNKIAGASTYRVYRKAANETTWTVVGDKIKATSFKDTTAKSGVKYSYTVRAYIGTALRGYYKASSAIIYLAAPAVKLSSSSASVKVTWGKVAGAKSYIVYRRPANSTKWTKLTTVSSSKLAFTDKGLKKGTSYVYTVRAVNGSQMSSYVPKTVKVK